VERERGRKMRYGGKEVGERERVRREAGEEEKEGGEG
jgi:hypothetical protein